MKKLITVALLAAMGLSLVSCSNDGGSSSGSSASGSETSASASGTASAATVGTAVQLSQEADEESATFDAIFAAVLLDGDGKIIDCEIDQTEYQPTPDGAEVDVRSKMEKGDDYGMVAAGASTMEWYSQVDAFEEYVVGMTGDEVAAIEMTDGKATDADLAAGCTISIESILANTEKAISAADAE